MWPSSTPFAVTIKMMSPTISGEQAAILCGKTSRSFIMSYSQMMSASVSVCIFVLETVVAVGETVKVGTYNRASIADVVNAIAVNGRSGAKPFVRPIVDLSMRGACRGRLARGICRFSRRST